MPSTTSSGPLTSSHRLLNDIRERILGSGHDTSIAISLLIQAIESPGLYVFGELLTLPSVTELSSMSSWPSHCSKRFEHPPQAYYRLLELFCLGTFRDYLLRRDALPPLSDAALSKLRQLTILSCAADSADRLLRYDALLEALGLADDVRALEQLTIALLYSGALHARLDQAARCVIVHSAAARDVSPPQLDAAHARLQSWSTACVCTTAALGTTVQRAEDRQRSQEAEEQRFSNELHGLQQTLRSLSTSVPAGVGGLSVGPRALSGLVPDVASASRTVPATESSERAKRAHVGPRHKEH